ncbi:MAG: AMIN domain-containing protein [Firmicutes bacterium]|nr:AMIN domain-containing protein [Bacillota bacterium]
MYRRVLSINGKSWHARLIVLSTILIAVFIPLTKAHAAGGSGEKCRIMSVSFQHVEGRGQAVIEASGPLSYKSFSLSNPDRLVLDLDKCQLGQPGMIPKSIPVADGIVKSLRIAQFTPQAVRIVFDLESSAGYQIQPAGEHGERLHVIFNRRLTGIRWDGSDGRQRVTIEGDGQLEYKTTVLAGPDRIALDFPDTTLIGIDKVIPDDQTIIKQIRAGQNSPGVARVVIDLQKDTRFRVYSSEDEPGKVVVDFGFRLVGVTAMRLDDFTQVRVKYTGRAPSNVEYLPSPHRLIMDFDDTVVDMPSRKMTVEDGVINRIDVEELDQMKARVTLYLPYYLAHSIRYAEDTEEIVLDMMKSFCWNKKIVVDPGHGGEDPGAIGLTGLREKDVNLDIALRLAKLLEKAGAVSLLTRDADINVLLTDRARLANGSGADVFLSIHANSFLNPEPNGTETFYMDNVPGSSDLANCVHQRLVAALKLKDRNVKKRDLFVLRTVTMPSCLVEVAFASNVEEEVLMMSPEFRGKAALAIFNGLQDFFRNRLQTSSRRDPAQPGTEQSPKECTSAQ